MTHDFNLLERVARKLKEQHRHGDALKIYLYMADGDHSLDAGYLGERIAECYEAVGDRHAARYWYGRRLEENPEIRTASKKARNRLAYLSIDSLLAENGD